MKIKPSKKDFRLSLGDRGEIISAAYLVERGYKVLDKKARTPYGELDLIAQIKETLVFVEVKTRSSKQFGLPEESVDLRKQKQMARLANAYIQKNALSKMKMRFDVISILYDGVNDPQIRHIQDAFDEPGINPSSESDECR